MKKCLIAALLALPFVFSSLGLAKQPTEHPLIRPYPGSVLVKNKCKYKKFDQYKFTVPGAKKNKTERKTVKGAYWKLTYQALDSKGKKRKDIGALEFIENYKAAALEKGGKIVLEQKKSLIFTLPRSDGESPGAGCRSTPEWVVNT